MATALFRPQTSWRHPLRVAASADTLDLLSEREARRYRLQRRLIGPAYHEANMQKFGAAVDAVLQRAVAELRQLHGARVDLKEWMHIVAVECLGAVVLSWSPGYVKDRSDHGSSAAGYYNWRRKSVFGLFPSLVVADLHTRWVSRAFAAVWRLGYERRADYKPLFAVWPRYSHSYYYQCDPSFWPALALTFLFFFKAVGQRVAVRIRKALRPAKARPATARQSRKPPPPPPPPPRRANDLMTDLLDLHEAKPAFTENYLRRLAVTNFGAGHETLCSTLTAIVAMVGSHPDVFRRVAAEIRQAAVLDLDPAGGGSIASARHARDRLPLTWASIREAQRLHPALAMSLPRTVPEPEPEHAAQTLRLHGFDLPPGTTVGCSPPALHRNPAIFGPDADVFRPERWLDADEPQLRHMERFNLVWGGGSRTCPGRHLAEMVVYKSVLALFGAFDVEAVMPPDDQIRYYFLAMLTGAQAKFREKKVVIVESKS